MDKFTWDKTEFGSHNYALLIQAAGARTLTEEEDALFIKLIKKFHQKNGMAIDWGRSNLRDVLVVNLKGEGENCDVIFAKAIGSLNLNPNELAWVGWHDQIETVEMPVARLVEYAIPFLFFGYGVVIANPDGEWLIEYKFDKAIYAARCEQ